MSVLIGIPSRSIRYLNIHKEGKNNNEECSVDARWTSPLVEKQDNYLVAITRFEVPMNRVPITQELTDCIEIFKYNETLPDDWSDDEKTSYPAIKKGQNVEKIGDGKEISEWLKFWETRVPAVEKVSVEACHTVFSFLNTLNSNIDKALLGTERVLPRIHPRSTDQTPMYNKFHFDDDEVANDTIPNAYFRISMNADFTFRVEMNFKFADKYYIKMSPALFNMLGFKEGAKADDYKFRMNFVGRRFMGDRDDATATPHPPYHKTARLVDFSINPRSQLGLNYQTVFGQPGATALELHKDTGYLDVSQSYAVETKKTVFVAPVSAADTINRVKKITFTSSLATTSDADAGGDVGTYRRVLTDFTLPVKTSFSFNPLTGVASDISENAASEYSYNNPNPSAGRFLQITDPSPLYELKLTAQAKCWNFEKNQFELEDIPLPIAGTFTVKMVFISRSELHRRERPDRITE